MESDEQTDVDGEPSLFALAATAAILFDIASYVTATLLYAVIGKTGVPLSPLILTIPLIPIYMAVMHVDQKLPHGKAKDRLLVAACFGPLLVALPLVVIAPLPVLVDTIPRVGAFGLTLTTCIVVGVLLMARAQWVNRDRN